MKSRISTLVIFACLVLGLSYITKPLIALGDDTVTIAPGAPATTVSVDPNPAPEVSTDSFIDTATQTVKDASATIKAKGTGVFTIFLVSILAIAQILVQFTKTRFFGTIFTKVQAGGKLAIVAICTVITTAVPMILSGVSVATTFLSGVVLSAIMVAGHQIYSAWFDKPAV